MTKPKKGKKPPSRKRYDEDNRVRSVRLNKEYNEHLDNLLEGLGIPYTEWVKTHIRKDEEMIEKKAEVLASRQVDPSVEDRIRCLENLIWEIFSITVNTSEFPPFCPRCESQKLYQCEGREVESTSTDPWIPTWKCPKCGFFLDTYKRIDSKSIKWINPDMGGYTKKSKSSTRREAKKK